MVHPDQRLNRPGLAEGSPSRLLFILHGFPDHFDHKNVSETRQDNESDNALKGQKSFLSSEHDEIFPWCWARLRKRRSCPALTYRKNKRPFHPSPTALDRS